MSGDDLLFSDMRCFAFQKAAFQMLKGHLLESERPSFGRRKVFA